MPPPPPAAFRNKAGCMSRCNGISPYVPFLSDVVVLNLNFKDILCTCMYFVKNVA